MLYNLTIAAPNLFGSELYFNIHFSIKHHSYTHQKQSTTVESNGNVNARNTVPAFHVHACCVTEMALLLLQEYWISFQHKLISDLLLLLKCYCLHMLLPKIFYVMLLVWCWCHCHLLFFPHILSGRHKPHVQKNSQDAESLSNVNQHYTKWKPRHSAGAMPPARSSLSLLNSNFLGPR